MRRALAIVGLVLLGCGPRLTHVAQEIAVRGIDFRPLSADGFLFTPNAYLGAHDALGLITISIEAEGNYRAIPNSPNYSSWQFERIAVDTALARAKAQVQELGGNAIVNLELRYSAEPFTSTSLRPRLEALGLAIRRHEVPR